MLPVIMLVLFALALLVPSLFHASERGPGSMHAPVLVAFAATLVVGALAQRSRLCMAGGVRDTLMLKDPSPAVGLRGHLRSGAGGQPDRGQFHRLLLPVSAHCPLQSHLEPAGHGHLVGWGSVLLGGCPLRQLVLAGSGNGDSAVTVPGDDGRCGSGSQSEVGQRRSPGLNESGEYVKYAVTANAKVAVAMALVVLLVVSCAM